MKELTALEKENGSYILLDKENNFVGGGMSYEGYMKAVELGLYDKIEEFMNEISKTQ